MYDRHLTMGDAKDEMQEQQRQEKIRWWRGLAEKTKWPNSGVYFVLPDNDLEATENEMILKHETGPEIPFRIDEGETMEYIKSFFGEVFPGAEVLIPIGL